MEAVTHSTEYLKYNTLAIGVVTINSTSNNLKTGNSRTQSIRLIQTSIASVGIVANLTIIVVFLNHKKLRRKIPNIFIINQVRINYIITHPRMGCQSKSKKGVS